MTTRSRNLYVPVLALLFGIALLFPSERVQPSLQAQGLGEKQRSSAQIRTSDRATELLQQAVEHRQNDETAKFLHKLQSAREDFGSWLVPVDDVDGLYTGVGARTTDLLQSLNQKERSTYREQFESSASKALRSATASGDPEALSELADRYPLTPSGQQALNELFTVHFKNGHFDEALRSLRTRFQFLRAPSDRAQTAQKIALCLSLTGQTRQLQVFSEQISEELNDQNVRWNDDLIPLETFVDRRIKNATEPSGDQPGDTESHAAWSPLHPTGFPEVPTHQLLSDTVQPRVFFTPSPGASRQFGHTRLSRTRQGIRNVSGIYPSRFNDRILHNNGISAWGWNIDPQNDQLKTAPTWTVSSERIEGSDVMKDVRQLYVGDVTTNGNYICSLVTGIGSTSIPTMNLRVRYPIPWRSLYSIDAKTGEVNWKLGGRTDTGFYKNASFPAGAVYRDGTLYAPAVKFQTSNQTPNIYAAAIDADTGELLWETFITKNMLGTNLFENPTREVIPAAPVVDQEQLYITTNTGMTVALDRENGHPRWLYRYIRWGSVSTRGIYPTRQSTFWQNNLPARVDRTLLITPTDSLRLLALDPDTGRTKWKQDQFDLSSTLQEFAEWVVPAGAQRYLISSQKAFAIYSGNSGRRLSGVYNSPVPIEGRPVVTEDYVGLPTSKGISLIEYEPEDDSTKLTLAEGALLEPGNQFQPGNVFVTGEYLLVAGHEEFMVYHLPGN